MRLLIIRSIIIFSVVVSLLQPVNLFAQGKTYPMPNGIAKIRHDDMKYDMKISMKENTYLITITNVSDIDLGIDLNVEKVYDDRSPKFTQHIVFAFFDFDGDAQAANLRIAKGEDLVLNFDRKPEVLKYVLRLEIFNRDRLVEGLKKKNVAYRIEEHYKNYHKQAILFKNYLEVRQAYDELTFEFTNGQLPIKTIVDIY